MSKKLSDEDKQWLKAHPGFHIQGDLSLGKPRKRIRRKPSEMPEREPTFSEKLDDFEAMNGQTED